MINSVGVHSSISLLFIISRENKEQDGNSSDNSFGTYDSDSINFIDAAYMVMFTV